MADEKELVRAFSDLTITSIRESEVQCDNNSPYSCLKISERMKPDCNFKCKIISCVEANIFINNVKHNIKATGSYSDIEICLMYGKTNDNKERSHWGIICQQEKTWVLNGKARKSLLFHHMGDGIELAVGCICCLRRRVMNVYDISKPNLVCFDFGRSSAAVRRFLNETSLGRNVSYKYNSKYRYGEVYYEWKTTNCCRLVFDLLFYLKLDYETAVKFTKVYTGNEHWDEVFGTIVEKYFEFTMKILKFWMKIKQNQDLEKVEKLLDGQYKLDDALKKFADKITCSIL